MQPYRHLNVACYPRINGEQQTQGVGAMADTLVVLYKANVPDKNRRRFNEIAPHPQGIGCVRLEPQLALEKPQALPHWLQTEHVGGESVVLGRPIINQ